jgi:RND family efflux transporter MFP subunit
MKARTIFRITVPILGAAAVSLFILQARGSSALCTQAAPAPVAKALLAVRAEGRVAAYPGAQVEVGTDVAGRLRAVLVREKDRVRRGQLLAEFDSDDLKAELDEARASLGAAEAELRLSEVEIDRAAELVRQEVAPRQDLDRRLRDRDVAAAKRETAAASISRLEALLAKTRIASPIDGAVIARHADAGETLDRGAEIVTVADLSKLRIEAEVDEYDSGRVSLSAPVTISAEGFDGSWQGRVEEIPDQVGPRILKPTDPGRPTDTRVLLVKVAFDGPNPLKLGQRVQVEVRRGA